MSGGDGDRAAGSRAAWSVPKFAIYLVGLPAAGLAAFFAAAPHRLDLLAAAGAGAAFGVGVSLGGYALVERSARTSIRMAVQVFLAAMTVKVLAFAAFLLTIAFTTSLNPAALAVGLVGATLVGEALVIASLRRVEGSRGPEKTLTDNPHGPDTSTNDDAASP